MARNALQDHLQVDALPMGVEAHLYKLLLYEEGGHFLSHRDTEKAKGMFATYLLHLPVTTGYEGGELVVRKGPTEKIYDFSSSRSTRSASSSSATKVTSTEDPCKTFYEVVFYADCEHELKVVKKGWRVVLAFNLIWKLPAKLTQNKMMVIPAGIAGMTHLLSSLKEIEKEWSQELDLTKQAMIGFPLVHQYTEKNFSFTALKAEDSLLAQALVACFDANRWEVCLYLENKYMSGLSDGSYNRVSKNNANNKRRPPRYPMIEVFQTEYNYLCMNYKTPQTITQDPLPIDCRTDLVGDNIEYIVSNTGRLLGFSCDNNAPDKEKFEGYTGNEGMGVEYWYNRGLLVVYPSQFTEALLDVRSNIGGLIETAWKKLEITGGWQLRSLQQSNAVSGSKKVKSSSNKSSLSCNRSWLDEVVDVFTTSGDSSKSLILPATVTPITVKVMDDNVVGQEGPNNSNDANSTTIKRILEDILPHMSHYDGQSEWYPLAVVATAVGSQDFFQMVDQWMKEKIDLTVVFQQNNDEDGDDDMFRSDVDIVEREKRMYNCFFYLATLANNDTNAPNMTETIKSWILALWKSTENFQRHHYLLPLSRYFANFCKECDKETNTTTLSSSSTTPSEATQIDLAHLRELDRYFLYDVIAKEFFETFGDSPWEVFRGMKSRNEYGYKESVDNEVNFLILFMYLLERGCGGKSRDQSDTEEDFILSSVRQRLLENEHAHVKSRNCNLLQYLTDVLAAVPMSKACLEPYRNEYFEGPNKDISREMIARVVAMVKNCHIKVLLLLLEVFEERHKILEAASQNLIGSAYIESVKKAISVLSMAKSERIDTGATGGIENEDQADTEHEQPPTKKNRKSTHK